MSLFGSIARTLSTSRKQPRPLRYIASRALVKSGLCSRIVLQRNGYRVRFHPSNVSVSMFLQGREYFAWEERYIQSLLREGDTFVDVGANIGNLTIAGKLAVKGGTVIAIEAHPRTFGFLAGNIRLNGLQVDARNVAVGDKAGTLSFSDMHADDCNGVNLSGDGIKVSVRALDDLLKGTGDIRLLKVDIEGYELFAFRGAREVLARTEMVYFELWDHLTARYGYSPREILQELEGAGFTVFEITPSGERRAVGSDFSVLQNYLAVRGAS